MKYTFKVVIVLTLILSTLSILAQTRSNPFDIKGRTRNVVPILPVVNEVVDDSLALITPSVVPSDTTTGNVQVDSIGLSPDGVFKSSNNPFEINHVPIRRKNLAEPKTKTTSGTTGVVQTSMPKQSKRSFLYWLLSAGLLLLTIVITASPYILVTAIRSVVNENILKLEHRSQGNNGVVNLLLYLIFFINVAIFWLLGREQVMKQQPTIQWFFIGLGFFMAIYACRHTVLYFIGLVFPLSKETSLYNYTIRIFNYLIGVILLPINLVLAFGPENILKPTFFLGVGIIAILLIFRSIRGLVIGIHHFFNHPLVFFVYLCTVEIAPILVLVRLIQLYS